MYRKGVDFFPIKGTAPDDLQTELPMPGNDIAEKIHNFFEQDNLSQGQQHQPPITSGDWSSLNNNVWVNNQRHNGPPHFSNQKNYNIQPADAGKDSESINGRQSSRMPFGPNLTQLSLTQETARSQQLNTNGFLHNPQGFQTRSNQAEFLGEDTIAGRHNLALRSLANLDSQQGHVQEHNPGLSRNSERLESAEAPVSFDFLGSQHQFMRGQQSSISQPQPRQQPTQQPGFNDLPLWQQQFFYKQMQELHRQRQIQQLDQEARHQNSLNQLSGIAKQTAGDVLPLVNGASIHNTSNILWPGELVHQMGGDSKIPSSSQTFMVGNTNWARSGLSTAQGFTNGVMLSHDQAQSFRSTGFLPQQLDHSSYGASIGSTRNTMIRPSNQYSNFQVISHDGSNMLTRAGGTQVAKAVMQSNAFNAFQADQSSVFPDQASIDEGASVSKQNFHGKNFFGHPSNLQSLNNTMPGNFQQLGSLARNSQFQGFHERQERASWSGSLEEKGALQVGPSQCSVNLDPAEEKILFNTGDIILDTAGGHIQNSQLEGTDFLNAFPTVQSGSWSALMQSAVAEASSSDTGIRDEWSGLSFQKTERSTGNPQLNDSGKQPTAWSDHNMQTASSLTSRPFPLFDESPSGQTASSFQQTTPKFMYEQCERAEGKPQGSHGVHSESLEHGKWLDHTPQHKHLVEGSRVPTPVHLENAVEGGWTSQVYNRAESIARSEDVDLDAQSMHNLWAPQQKVPSYKMGNNQPCNKLDGWNINESLSLSGDNLQSHDNERGHIGMEQVKCGMGNPHVHDDCQNNFAPMLSSNMLTISQENQQTLNSHQFEYNKHNVVDSSAQYKGNENTGIYQNQSGKHSQAQESSANNSDRASSERHDRKREKSYQKESPNDGYISDNLHPGQQTVTGSGGGESSWLVGSDSHHLVGGNQKLSGQVARKTSVRKFNYHPMGNVNVDLTQTGTSKHATHSLAQPHLVSRGPRGQEAGYYGHPKFVGTVTSSNSVDLEKGHIDAGSQRVPKGVEDASSKAVIPGYDSTISTSFDGSAAFYTPNKRTAQTSQNMLELLNKVDQPRESNLMRFGSCEMSEPTGSNTPSAHLHQNQSQAVQGFGLRLAPPSQRIPISKPGLSSQASSQIGNDSRHFDPEVGNKGQTWIQTPVTGQSLPHAQELSQREHWGNTSSIPGQAVHVLPSGGHRDPHSDIQENASTLIGAGLYYSKNQSEHQQVSSSSEFLGHERSTIGSHSQPTNINSSPIEPPPVSQHSCSPGNSQQVTFSTMLHNASTNRPAQQHVVRGTHKVPQSLFPPGVPSSSSLEPTSWTAQKVDEQMNIDKGGNRPYEFGPCSINAQQFVSGEEQPVKDNSLQQTLLERDGVTRINFPFSQANLPSTAGYTLSSQAGSGSLFQSHVQEPLAKHLSNANSPTSSLSVVHLHGDVGRGKLVQDASVPSQKEHGSGRNVEAPTHSGKPSDPLQNYSLLNQIRAMKSSETDPNMKAIKRPKVAEHGTDGSHVGPTTSHPFMYGYNTMAIDPVDNDRKPEQHFLFPTADNKKVNFSVEGADNRNVNRDFRSQDMITTGSDPQYHGSSHFSLTSSPSSIRVTEHSQVSPQFAPSWFDQYGTYKNGQILATYDGLGVSRDSSKPTSKQLFFGNASGTMHAQSAVEERHADDANQVCSVLQNTTSIVAANEQLASSYSSLPDAGHESFAIVRLKKRKRLVAWHKEVMQSSQELRNISVAELEWAHVTNRRIEKVDDETEMMEDGLSMPRPRRRLILTTQLMQQLIRAVPASILSAEASSDYESVTYFIAKVALRDACSLISCLGSDSNAHPDDKNSTFSKLNSSGRVGGQIISKVLEDYTDRTKKLENDLLRLDKRASFLDLRVECQELEKFSIINRFAKYHGRGPADGGESSSADGAIRRPYPQRYVMAFPMPRKLPDGVPCLSL